MSRVWVLYGAASLAKHGGTPPRKTLVLEVSEGTDEGCRKMALAFDYVSTVCYSYHQPEYAPDEEPPIYPPKEEEDERFEWRAPVGGIPIPA